MDIREAQPDDYALIRGTVREAFSQNVEADLIEALRASGEVVLELVAEIGDLIIGHLLLSELRTPNRCVALAPVSVLPSNQGRGVGSALIRMAIERAQKYEWLAIFLLGEPDYYSRFGFSVEACTKFETDYPKSHMMVLELTDGGLEGLSGRITYAEAFSRDFGSN